MGIHRSLLLMETVFPVRFELHLCILTVTRSQNLKPTVSNLKFSGLPFFCIIYSHLILLLAEGRAGEACNLTEWWSACSGRTSAFHLTPLSLSFSLRSLLKACRGSGVPRRPGFDSCPYHVISMVHKLTPGRVVFRVFWCFPVIFIVLVLKLLLSEGKEGVKIAPKGGGGVCRAGAPLNQNLKATGFVHVTIPDVSLDQTVSGSEPMKWADD